MGQSITIACPSAWKLTSFSKFLEGIAHDERVVFSSFDDQLQIVAKDSRWKLIVSEVADRAAAVEEYASNADLDERFREEVVALHFFSVSFDDVDMARRLLRSVAQEFVRRCESAWIDTDYGWVIHARDLLKETANDPRWDWRKSPSNE